MVTLVVFHHVRDFDAWRGAFEEHETVRRGHGALEHRVYRGVDDSLRVIVHNDFPSEEAARALMADPSLPTAMERGGVTDEPWLGLIEQLEQKRYTDGTAAVTAAVHHRVRDYEVWKQVFDAHEDVRRRHGQIDTVSTTPRRSAPARRPQRLPRRCGSRGVRLRSSLRTRWPTPASRASPVSTWPRWRSASSTSPHPDDGARADRCTRDAASSGSGDIPEL